MKKVVVLIFALLLVPLLSAIEIDMNEEFAQGETLMAKVSGNFLLPLQEENVIFYRGHVEIPIDYGVKKINDDYYIYALLTGKSSGNYSVSLENIRYMKGGEISEENVVKDFTITNQTADFSVNPGFASGAEFSLEVQNLLDEKITIEVATTGDTDVSSETYPDSATLKSGQTEELEFSFVAEEETFRTIELSTENLVYEIPVLIPVAGSLEEEFKLEPSDLTFSAAVNSEINKTIYIYNTGEVNITNITLSLSDSLSEFANLSQNFISGVEAGSNVQIELIFFSENETEVDGYLKAKSEEEIVYSKISAEFLEESAEGEEEEDESGGESSAETCEELGYEICDSNEECDGDIIYAKDNVCCIGTCVEEEERSYGLLIGILILVAVAVAGFWFYKNKYRKARKPVDLLKVARGKSGEEKNEKRKTEKINSFRRTEAPTRIIERPVLKIVEKPVLKEVEKKVFVEKPKPKTYRYVASSNTKTYHKESCRLAKLIKDEYKEQNDSIEYFQKKKYKPCKVCLKSD